MIIEIDRCDIVCVVEVMVELWVCMVLPFRLVIAVRAVSICVI